MVQSPFPVQRSLLAEDALAERMLSHYNLPIGTHCYFWQRSINDTYLVESGENQHILRVCPAHWRSREHVLAEMRLLRFLGQQGLTVPQPVEQRDDTNGLIDEIRRRPPDIVLIDTNMERNGTLETLSALKAEAPFIPCLVIVSNARQLRMARSAGADGMLLRGFSSAELAGEIRRLTS